MMHATIHANQKERTARRFWVTLILAFFAMDLGIAVIAIVMAAGDPSFRSIPGFGERAVAWDERRRLNEAWQQQNWDISIERVHPENRAIEIRLLRDNIPVSHCSGTLRVFHFTRVAEQRTVALREVSPGIYRADVDVSKPGMWNVEIELVTREQTRCWNSFTKEWLEQDSMKNHSP